MNVPRTIQGAARETGYAPDTIRELERKGIVSPARDTVGRRIFFDQHIEAIRNYRERQHRGLRRND